MSCIWTLQLEVSISRRGNKACDFVENGINHIVIDFDTESFTQCHNNDYAWPQTPLGRYATALTVPSRSRTTITPSNVKSLYHRDGRYDCGQPLRPTNVHFSFFQ